MGFIDRLFRREAAQQPPEEETVSEEQTYDDLLPNPGFEIEKGKTAVVITDPQKVYGPESNDLVVQLRKKGIDKVILGGMSANLCVEAHLRELTEQGFEVAVVKDATAGAQLPGGDFYAAAILNFRMIASSVQTTDEIVDAMEKA